MSDNRSRAAAESARPLAVVTGASSGIGFAAVYNGAKALIDSSSFALRNELKDTGVTVTCLTPGVTDTSFFERADLMGTKVGQDDKKMDPAKVAAIGYEAHRL